MWEHIQAENKDIMQFVKDNSDRISTPKDNVDLCRSLGIGFPYPNGKLQNYQQKDIKVYLYE
jgi:hypothetical protein